MGQVGEEFRVPGKSDTGLIDHAFVHRSGDHAGKMPVQAALAGAGEGFQDESGVGFVQLPGDHVFKPIGLPRRYALLGSARCKTCLFGACSRPIARP